MMDAQVIAEQNCILRSVVGSHLHGLNIPGSDDTDEMGVCLEPPECVVGLRHFEQWVSRTQPDGVKSGPGDKDITVYSLRKYCRLALGGNPTILLLLFSPLCFHTVHTSIGSQLQSLASAFIAKSVAKPFLGYMMAQRQRLVGERGQKRVKRPELEERYGFDTKYAAHILRLGLQGIELLTTGRLTLPMTLEEREYLVGVRTGSCDLQTVLTHAGELEKRLEDCVAASPLPETPDVHAVNEFLIRAYTAWWSVKHEAFRVQIAGADALLQLNNEDGRFKSP